MGFTRSGSLIKKSNIAGPREDNRGLDLEQRIDEGRDGGSLGEDDEASEQCHCDDNGKQPDFLPSQHIQPKLRWEFHFFTSLPILASTAARFLERRFHLGDSCQ
jgi:hypothetical protein